MNQSSYGSAKLLKEELKWQASVSNKDIIVKGSGNAVAPRSARLTKISDNANALRTNPVLGVFFDEPTVGESFVLFSEPLENHSADARVVWTSAVQSIERVEGMLIMKTFNSIYRLTVFDDFSNEKDFKHDDEIAQR